MIQSCPVSFVFNRSIQYFASSFKCSFSENPSFKTPVSFHLKIHILCHPKVELKVMSLMNLRILISQLQDSEFFFTFMVDETTDISHTEQVS